MSPPGRGTASEIKEAFYSKRSKIKIDLDTSELVIVVFLLKKEKLLTPELATFEVSPLASPG